ncbi:MAG TPA: hypothetical protein VGS28_04625 [Candidatus Saccharimonadales bacterium]|nr:hypothetical protein [Candidatus Saccharimonadales bacterium]
MFSVTEARDVAMGRDVLRCLGAGDTSRLVFSELATNALGKPDELGDAQLAAELASLGIEAPVPPLPRTATEASTQLGCLVTADVIRPPAAITTMQVTSPLDERTLRRLRSDLAAARRAKLERQTRPAVKPAVKKDDPEADKRAQLAGEQLGRRGLRLVVELSHEVTTRALRGPDGQVIGVVIDVLVFDPVDDEPVAAAKSAQTMMPVRVAA